MHGAGYKWVLVKEGEEKAPADPTGSGRQPAAEAEELSSTSSLDRFYGASVKGPGGAPADAERTRNLVRPSELTLPPQPTDTASLSCEHSTQSSADTCMCPQTLHPYPVNTQPRAVLTRACAHRHCILIL